MHHIHSIVNIKPYRVTVLFDNNEQREIDFTPLLNSFPALKEPSVFAQASIDDYPTLVWNGLAQIRELDGTIVPCALDFCPDALYEMSISV